MDVLAGSLLSGGLVAFLSYIVSMARRIKTRSNLRYLLYYEIDMLHSHMLDIFKCLEQERDAWYRNQIGVGIKSIVFNNLKVQEELISLGQDEIKEILKFYSFYSSISGRLELYSKLLREKMELDKHNQRNFAEIRKYIELLIESSNDLNNDFNNFKKIFENIEARKKLKRRKFFW